jgi:cobalt/nickel transport protein
MAKNVKQSLVLLLVLAVWVAWLLLRASSRGEMVGADEQAEALIERHHASYRRWAKPVWVAPGSEAETLLFSLQAGIGGLILGYAIGRSRRPRP